MSLLRSAPQPRPPWRDLLAAALATWILPALLGAAGLAVMQIAGRVLDGGAALAFHAIALLLAFSPLLSFSGLLIAVPLASVLLRHGWFGWLPAGALGLGIGAVLAKAFDLAIAAPFGLIALLLFRAVLGRLRPLAPSAQE